MKLTDTSQLMCLMLLDEQNLKDTYIESIAKLNQWISSEGEKNAIKRWKTLSHALILFITGQPAEKQEDGMWYKTSQLMSGCPKMFSPFAKWCLELDLTDHEHDRRLGIVMSLLSIIDIIEGKPSQDEFEEFKKKAERPKVIKPKDVEQFSLFLDLFLKRNKSLKWVQRLQSFDPQPNIHESLKSGPNDGPALLTAHRDMLTLLHKDKDLLKDLKQLSDVMGTKVGSNQPSLSLNLSDVTIWYQTLVENGEIESYLSRFPARHGVLRLLPAKAGKVRPVAIVDHVTQTVMGPIHDHLMRVLNLMGELNGIDGTYDQDRAVRYISDLITEGYSFTGRDGKENRFYTCFSASFDQSSCTERFPIEIQERVISTFLPKGATLWRRCLTNRYFTFEYEGKTSQLMWESGQPLGALSSWAAMAVSHHLMVQYAAYRAFSGQRTMRYFSQYAILGDDIVILDQKVANAYQQICKEWGMEINLSKSHITSRLGGRQLVTEFAKRVLINGRKIPLVRATAFQSALSDGKESVGQLYRLISDTQIIRLKKRTVLKVIKMYWPDMVDDILFLLALPRTLKGTGLKIHGNPKELFKVEGSGLPSLIPFLLMYKRALKRRMANSKTTVSKVDSLSSRRASKKASKRLEALMEEIHAIPRDVYKHPLYEVLSRSNDKLYDFDENLRKYNNSLLIEQDLRDEKAHDQLLVMLDLVSSIMESPDSPRQLMCEIAQLEHEVRRDTIGLRSSISQLMASDSDPLLGDAMQSWNSAKGFVKWVGSSPNLFNRLLILLTTYNRDYVEQALIGGRLNDLRYNQGIPDGLLSILEEAVNELGPDWTRVCNETFVSIASRFTDVLFKTNNI